MKLMQMQENNIPISYFALVSVQFRKHKPALWSLRLLCVLLFIALFADFIANDKPLYCKYKNENYFPVFHELASDFNISTPQNINWKKVPLENVLWTPIRYLPRELDFDNAQYVPPNQNQNIPSKGWTHWLGTDALGQDVFSGLIHGTRIALSVGIFSMLLAAILGIFFGVSSGYLGDNSVKISRASIFIIIIFSLLGFFYSFQCRAYILEDALNESFGKLLWELLVSKIIFWAIIFTGYLVSRPLSKLPWLSKKIKVPLDQIISRFVEVFNTIPRLLLIFAFIILIKPSLYLVTIVIGLTSWTDIAIFVRAEMLKIRNLEYIETAKALGFSKLRIILRHALPNAMGPILITLSFGVAGAILTESALSFLGIGVPIDSLSWGKLLAHAQSAPKAWWLAVFPGLAIFLTVTAFNLIGEGLTEAIDPRQSNS